MDEIGAEIQTLKFTFDMRRGNMPEDEIGANGVALALTALADNKQAVVARQTSPEGYVAVERA